MPREENKVHTEGRRCEDSEDPSANQGTPKTASQHQELGERLEHNFPLGLRGN